MNRFLVAAVVGLMAVGATGCATGIEDPQPAPAPATQSRGAPQTPFNAEITDEAPPDPALIGTGVDTPEPDLDFKRPVPVDGEPQADDGDAIDPAVIIQEAPING